MPAEAADGSKKLTYFTSVGRFLQSSSAATLISESGNAKAIAIHAEAKGKYELAIKARESGDHEAANAALDEAVRLLYVAVGTVNKETPGQEKESRDFDDRRRSVDALLAAFSRIADEKGLRQERQALEKQVAADLKTADELFAAGQITAARQELDSVYETVRISIKGMREGETLVRELNFESPEDEYNYELTRNDTHQMLIKVLLSEKMDEQSVRDRIGPFMTTAEQLRTEAEAMADGKKFEQAIDLLERSTSELVKAIRSAGVYIPG